MATEAIELAEPGRASVETSTLADLAVSVWRIERRARRSGAAETVLVACEMAGDRLRSLGVEMQDLTGVPYDENLNVRVIDRVEGEGAERIAECLAPAVYWEGALIRQAEVTVEGSYMDRQTVDFGIDLGTTNSAVARATAKGVRIVKNRLQGDTTSSAVARTTTGQTLVGEDALGKPDLYPATRFKRLMGTSNQVPMGDQTALLPEELSAEVLKELKAAVQLRYALDLEHVVVTVPAMFQQPQCDATHRAAKLAGLNAVTLLQEPIAAATAYLDEAPEEGDYLVYDLGGGTFDVSLVRLRDGHMSVVAHGGDNYLGGSDFDKSLTEWVINALERRHGALPQIAGNVARYRLRVACEDAKKRLSQQEETFVDLGDLNLPVAQLPITRAILEDLIEEPISRTIRLAHERIAEAGLTARDIHSVLLVGGPTMMPYVRRRLKDELGIPVSVEQDPMTAVAVGAAIHASTLLVPLADRAPAQASGENEKTATLELHYEPVSPDVRTVLAGKVVEPAGFTGEVRVTRARGDWETGWIPLRNGAFVCEVTLETGTVTEFTMVLRDMSGRIYDASPSSVTLRNGVAVATAVTPYDYGVALADGTFHVIVERNKPLPTYGSTDVYVARTIQAGSPDEFVVYLLEGMSPTARENTKVGELRVRGTNLTRTLREGERVEVRFNFDESRAIKARVSIPLFDLDYAVDVKSLIETPNVADLQASLLEAERAAVKIQEVVKDTDERRFRAVRHDLDVLAADMERLEKGELGEAERVASKLADVKANLHPLTSNYALLSLYEEVQEMLGYAERITKENEDRLGIATVADLRAEAEKCLRLEDEKQLRAVLQRATSLHWKHYSQTRECWVEWVVYLRENREFASDRPAYEEWLKRAHDCLARGDYEGVRLNSWEAASYLPKEKALEDRFFDAGVVRN